MKRDVVVQQSFCDVCGKESSGYNICINCGKDFCYECMKTSAIEYKHAVHFSGSDDGLYCTECNQKLISSGGDKLHSAYRLIAHLRHEEIGWYDEFKCRADKAEEALKSLLKKRRNLPMT